MPAALKQINKDSEKTTIIATVVVSRAEQRYKINRPVICTIDVITMVQFV